MVVNGGIASLYDAEAHLAHVDGVMLGRAAYHTPAMLGAADRRLFDAGASEVSAFEAVTRYLPYARAELAAGTRLAAMTRHMLGLFHGARGEMGDYVVSGPRRACGGGIGSHVFERVHQGCALGADSSDWLRQHGAPRGLRGQGRRSRQSHLPPQRGA